MKAISLWQPWATLVAIGAKRIETRGRPWTYRGQLAIHAAKKWNRELRRLALSEPFVTGLGRIGGLAKCYDGLGLPFGEIIAFCRLVDCIEIKQVTHFYSERQIPPEEPERSFGDYTPGRFAWILEDIVRLAEPFPYRGRQGAFEVPDDLLRKAGPQ